LVEGYTDVITLHQSGIENVVASSGTALTPDQIRLIKRLTPNITVLYDGDAAGIRASFRGIDLILEQDLNVKVLTFPNQDDPDSYARKVSSEELKEYLTHNATDFIKFKISILMEEAANDPIKKAELVKDIIKSISVIPNSIQREIYLQETAKLMEISEGVLYSSLAQQIVSNRKQDGEQRIGDEPVRMEIVQESQQPHESINELEKYEKEVIKTLLLFGNIKTEFVDWVEETNTLGKTEIKKEIYENVVAQEIYLNLQDDEIEFTKDVFKSIYSILITQFNLNQNIDIKHFTNHENPLIAQLASDVVLEEDKYILSKWESRDIVVKPKESHISKQVTDIILNLRRVLIDEKIKTVMQSIKDKHPQKEQIEEVLNYTRLRKLVFDKLHRVV
jgi:DNA primase